MSRKKIVASTTTNDGWVQPKPKKEKETHDTRTKG